MTESKAEAKFLPMDDWGRLEAERAQRRYARLCIEASDSDREWDHDGYGWFPIESEAEWSPARWINQHTRRPRGAHEAIA